MTHQRVNLFLSFYQQVMLFLRLVVMEGELERNLKAVPFVRLLLEELSRSAAEVLSRAILLTQ